MDSGKVNKVLVELDVLLDTRLGTIALHKPEIIPALLENGYTKRDMDEFPGISQEEFKKLYAERDELTLSESIITGAVGFLRNYASVSLEQAVKRPYFDRTVVQINTYPFDLSDETIGEIVKSVSFWLAGIVDVEAVSYAPEVLAPDFVDREYSMLMMYNYEHWMDVQTKAFEEKRISTVTLFSPRIYFGKRPSKNELSQLVANAMHPFQAIEVMASPLVELKLLDVDVFSCIVDK